MRSIDFQEVCAQFPTSAVNVTLLAVAVERRAAASCCGAVAAGRSAPPLPIDLSHTYGAQQQTRRTPRLRSDDRTDGRTLDRSIYPAPHSTRAASINVESTVPPASAISSPCRHRRRRQGSRRRPAGADWRRRGSPVGPCRVRSGVTINQQCQRLHESSRRG